MEANQWRSRTAAWLPRQRRSTPAPFLYAMPALPGVVFVGKSFVYVCLFVSVSKTAVLVHARNRDRFPHYPQSRVPAFCENSLKIVVCLVEEAGLQCRPSAGGVPEVCQDIHSRTTGYATSKYMTNDIWPLCKGYTIINLLCLSYTWHMQYLCLVYYNRKGVIYFISMALR